MRLPAIAERLNITSSLVNSNLITYLGIRLEFMRRYILQNMPARRMRDDPALLELISKVDPTSLVIENILHRELFRLFRGQNMVCGDTSGRVISRTCCTQFEFSLCEKESI
jgi:hypothetical protein